MKGNTRRKEDERKCRCRETSVQKKVDPRKGFTITNRQLQAIKEDINLGIPVDVSAIKEDREQRKAEMRKRIDEFRQLDEKFGHSSKETAHSRSLADDIELAKREFYLERAKVIKLRECDDFKDMNSFVYKAKCQAIRDHQIRQKEVMEKDEEELLDQEIAERYKELEEGYEKELSDRADVAKVNQVHLKSLKSMIKEKEIDNELTRLKYQQAAAIRNSHTAYRLKKRLEEITDKTEDNKKIRALQRGVYENRNQMNAILKTENRTLDQREKDYFEKKSNYLRQYNDEKDSIQKQKNVHLDKLLEDAKKRNENEQQNQELAYVRDKDLADKKWREEVEARGKKAREYREELWAEQVRTKEDLLDHICCETERERLDLQRIVRENQEDYDQEQKHLQLLQMKTQQVRKDLQCTINEKIDREREEKQRRIESAHNQVLNNRLHLKFHDREMFRELNRLRNEGLEETYITETMRHNNITPNQKLKASSI